MDIVDYSPEEGVRKVRFGGFIWSEKSPDELAEEIRKYSIRIDTEEGPIEAKPVDITVIGES